MKLFKAFSRHNWLSCPSNRSVNTTGVLGYDVPYQFKTWISFHNCSKSKFYCTENNSHLGYTHLRANAAFHSAKYMKRINTLRHFIVSLIFKRVVSFVYQRWFPELSAGTFRHVKFTRCSIINAYMNISR
jgi:hypothetical protein